MDYIKSKYRKHTSRKDTSALREKLQMDLKKIGQDGRVLKAFDIFLTAKGQHEANVQTARGLGATAGGLLAQTAQAAYDVSKNCPVGSDGASKMTCGLSAGNLAGAALGIYGLTVAVKMLRDGRSHVSIVQQPMDLELATKLRRHATVGNNGIVDQYGQNLVSDFALLTEEDQKLIREQLRRADPEPEATVTV